MRIFLLGTILGSTVFAAAGMAQTAPTVATTQPPAVEAQIAARLAQEGYTDVSGILKQGDVWIVQAKRNGRTETVTVDEFGTVSPVASPLPTPSDSGSTGGAGSESGTPRR
jgi:hypothetical protein